MIEEPKVPKCIYCNEDMKLWFGGKEGLRQYKCNNCNTSIAFKLIAGKWERIM